MLKQAITRLQRKIKMKYLLGALVTVVLCGLVVSTLQKDDKPKGPKVTEKVRLLLHAYINNQSNKINDFYLKHDGHYNNKNV